MLHIQNDRGTAILGALLLALVLFALGTAFSASALTEVSVVRNHQRSAEARAAADAGLTHAVQLAVRRLNAWQANGFASPRAAITALLRGPDNAVDAMAGHPSNADNGSLEALELAGETEMPRFPTFVGFPAIQGASYNARIVDEDHLSRNLSAADRTRINENGQPEADSNRRAVIQVTAVALDNTTITLEAIIGRTSAPAIVSDQSMTISGSPLISGVDGDVHSNQNLTITGSPNVQRDATATGVYTVSGSPTVGGESGGGRQPIPIPAISAADYRGIADFVLGVGGLSGGKVYGPFADPATGALGPLLCDASLVNAACALLFGWVYEPANNGWSVSSSLLATGTYYVQGNVRIAGNPGSWGFGPPEQVSIIAEGSINISGTPRFEPETPGIMFITDRDLEISGNMEMTAGIEGLIFVREQMSISGNPELCGQILIDNASNLSGLVVNTTIVGNPTITYNGTLGGNAFSVTGWREIR